MKKANMLVTGILAAIAGAGLSMRDNTQGVTPPAGGNTYDEIGGRNPNPGGNPTHGADPIGGGTNQTTPPVLVADNPQTTTPPVTTAPVATSPSDDYAAASDVWEQSSIAALHAAYAAHGLNYLNPYEMFGAEYEAALADWAAWKTANPRPIDPIFK